MKCKYYGNNAPASNARRLWCYAIDIANILNPNGIFCDPNELVWPFVCPSAEVIHAHGREIGECGADDVEVADSRPQVKGQLAQRGPGILQERVVQIRRSQQEAGDGH